MPNVQIGIQMYLNSTAAWMWQMEGANNFWINSNDIKMKLYLCQVRRNPSVYREFV